MSGGSVSVLAPNGRRQTVKCTPNTTLLQVLEEVCKKQSLVAEEYDLKHHNKVLDTSTTFRFSGLPNNAQLEMAPASKLRLESEITLAVNLENGNRLIGTFTPSNSLMNVLKQLCPESLEEGKHPVVIYTRREIYGQELEKVTLRALGLTGGRAMIRLINKLPEELGIQANVATPLPSKPAEEKPYQRKFQPLEEQVHSVNTEKMDAVSGNADVEGVKPDKLQKKNNVDLLKLAREKRKNNDHPSPHHDEKRKSLSESQPRNDRAKAKPNDCECKRANSMEVDCCDNCGEACKDNPQNMEDEFVFLGERNAMLFSLETAQAVPSEDLPDDFFELTIDDARKILRDVKKQRFQMDHTPLMTSALRSLEESKKQMRQLNRYRKAIVRVQFPDRTVLQGTFKPTETVKDVVEFVRGFLEDASIEFYIYSTPPKCILEESKRLIELGFVPGAMVHFGTNNPDRKCEFLRRDLQDKFTSNSVASLAASRMRGENTRECGNKEAEDDYEMEDTPRPISDEGASTSSGITHDLYGERKIVKSTENVPKWFKP